MARGSSRTREPYRVFLPFGDCENDVWAGTTSGGLFHYDGETWSEIVWEGDNCIDSHSFMSMWSVGGIVGMWGYNGTLYFYTGSLIARVIGSEVEVLASWPCSTMTQKQASIYSMWGNSADEVFFTIVDPNSGRECGATHVVWFDGSEFHEF